MTPRTDAVMDAKYDSRDDLFEALLDHARDLERENKELLGALLAAERALRYCSVDPRMLHPLNNSPVAVAFNALTEIQLAISKARLAANHSSEPNKQDAFTDT